MLNVLYFMLFRFDELFVSANALLLFVLSNFYRMLSITNTVCQNSFFYLWDY